MSKNLIGKTVMIPANFTGAPTRKVIVKRYDKDAGYLCENLEGEPLLLGWFTDIFDTEGNPL